MSGAFPSTGIQPGTYQAQTNFSQGLNASLGALLSLHTTSQHTTSQHMTFQHTTFQHRAQVACRLIHKCIAGINALQPYTPAFANSIAGIGNQALQALATTVRAEFPNQTISRLGDWWPLPFVPPGAIESGDIKASQRAEIQTELQMASEALLTQATPAPDAAIAPAWRALDLAGASAAVVRERGGGVGPVPMLQQQLRTDAARAEWIEEVMEVLCASVGDYGQGSVDEVLGIRR